MPAHPTGPPLREARGTDATSKAMPQAPIVYVVDDERGVTELIRRLLAASGVVVVPFHDATTFLAAYDPDRPGCLVLDLRLPDLSGIQIIERLRDLDATQPIVFISGYAEVAHAIQAMKLGVHDFLEKPFTNDAILAAIQSALTRDAAARAERALMGDVAQLFARLSNRETQVMEMVVQGLPNRVIAENLELSPKTIEVHRANVMAKLKVDSLADLVKLAMKHFGS